VLPAADPDIANKRVLDALQNLPIAPCALVPFLQNPVSDIAVVNDVFFTNPS
jgi:hypothetical protein